MIRTYTELSQIQSYKERFEYLKLDGNVGKATFGSRRYLNQKFYSSEEWKRVRDIVIVRDLGCDLGVQGYDIFGTIQVHHMNPMIVNDVISHSSEILNPEFLVCTSSQTHRAIHYGTEDMLVLDPVCRTKNDTCPWKKS